VQPDGATRSRQSVVAQCHEKRTAVRKVNCALLTQQSACRNLDDGCSTVVSRIARRMTLAHRTRTSSKSASSLPRVGRRSRHRTKRHPATSSGCSPPTQNLLFDCMGRVTASDHTSLIWSACQEPEDTDGERARSTCPELAECPH